MTNDQLDHETVAAFLDGTLPEGERARVLKVLAASPELYSSVLEAVKVSSELAREDTSSVRVLPRRGRIPTRVRIAIPFLAAAGLAGVLIARRDNPPAVILIARSAQLTAERGDGVLDRSLGTAWDQPGWAVARGGDGAPSVGGMARAGARIAQLEFAATANDSTAYARVAASLSELLGTIDGAGPIAEQLRGGGIPAATARTTLSARLRALTATTAAFDLGIWLETARQAARLGHADYFTSTGQSADVLRLIEAELVRQGASDAFREVLALITPLTQSDASLDVASLRARTDSAMTLLPR